MGETEYKIFIVLATLILLVFIGGIITFVVQYHKRKLLHEKEKTTMNEQHRQQLLETRLEIQSQTMQDIGREIHDNVGQKLTLAAIYANQLSFNNQYPQINEKMAEVGKIINESLAELRSLSKSLANTNTGAAELKALTEHECQKVNALNICTVECSFNRNKFNLPATVNNFVIRILQEFMQNSLKHADCRNITIAIEETETGLKVTAKDDGKGFDMNDTTGNGIGLNNMKKRAELIGADYSIQSVTGGGTSMKLFIPAHKLNT